MVEQVEAVLHRDQVARHGVTDILEVTGRGYLARVDDAVAVLVGIGVFPREHTADREARRVPQRTRADGRIRLAGGVEAQGFDQVGVVRSTHRHVPRKVAAVEQRGRERHFMPGIAHRTDVRGHGEVRVARRTGRRRDRQVDQCILREVVVVRVFDVDAAAEQLGLETVLTFRGTLRLQERVAERGGHKARRISAGSAQHARWKVDVGGPERLERRGGSRLHARRAVRAAEAQRIQDAELGKPCLVGHDVRHTGLGIQHALELRSERAVLVGACGQGQEKPIADRDELLHIVTERLAGARKGTGCRLNSGLIHRLRPRG